jgi:hypothetical protein
MLSKGQWGIYAKERLDQLPLGADFSGQLFIGGSIIDKLLSDWIPTELTTKAITNAGEMTDSGGAMTDFRWADTFSMVADGFQPIAVVVI